MFAHTHTHTHTHTNANWHESLQWLYPSASKAQCILGQGMLIPCWHGVLWRKIIIKIMAISREFWMLWIHFSLYKAFVYAFSGFNVGCLKQHIYIFGQPDHMWWELNRPNCMSGISRVVCNGLVHIPRFVWAQICCQCLVDTSTVGFRERVVKKRGEWKG